MGACASKFTVLKNTSTAPPPAVKCEVEPGEVNLVEEVAIVEKDDDANRRQSLGHLLQEGEEKKVSADSNCKASEDVNHNDAAEAKAEAVAADGPVQDEREIAPVPVVDDLKTKCADEEIPANQNVEVEADKIQDKPAETLEQLGTTETPQENEAVEVHCTETEPATLESEKTEAKKPACDEEVKKGEEKLAEATELEASDKTPETPDEKSTEIIETPEKKPEATEEKKPEATEEQKPASETEKKHAEEKPCETSDTKAESPVIEKTEEQKRAADADKNVMEEKPTENEASDKVEDKHVLEPQTAENLLASKAPETCSEEEQKPASDAEKPKAEEEKAK